MKLSERLLSGCFQGGHVTFSELYDYDRNTKLSDEILHLEDENTALRTRLDEVHNRAEFMVGALDQLETVLAKFNTPG